MGEDDKVEDEESSDESEIESVAIMDKENEKKITKRTGKKEEIKD